MHLIAVFSETDTFMKNPQAPRRDFILKYLLGLRLVNVNVRI